ncbi:PfkB family carbohydrate kinase, partial [Micromonospora craterilacus]
GRMLRAGLGAAGVPLTWLVDTDRPTVVKKRISVGGHTLLRLDEGLEPRPNPATAGTTLVAAAQAAIETADAVVISDYDHGTLGNPEQMFGGVGDMVLVVDARHPHQYAGLRPTAVTPNYAEAVTALGLTALDDGAQRLEQLRDKGPDLLGRTGAGCVVVTLASLGAMVFEPNRRPYHSRAPQRVPGESIGAGDAFAAAFVLALASGADPPVATELATQAATTAVAASAGTAVVDRASLMARWHQPSKLLTPDDLGQWVAATRRAGCRIVFTNGCFDLLHEGHVTFLSQARALGEVLLVAVNDDASVRALKGAQRPVVPLDGRLRMLSALSCVDGVFGFAATTATELIRRVRPDIYAKGGDYRDSRLPESAVLAELGIEVRVLDYLPERSTTSIIDRVRALG